MSDKDLCASHGCPEPVGKWGGRGYCSVHYRRRLRLGHAGYGFQDAEPVRAHVRQLRALGWTWGQIGDAAGISHAIPYNLVQGRRYRRVLAHTRDALLAVPLTVRESSRGVDATGTRRRVQALAWMGWPCAEVARRAGVSGPSLAAQMRENRNRVSVRVALRIAGVFEELSHLGGPSPFAAGRARGFGFAPPLAWDDDTIDDPTAKPAGAAAMKRRARTRLVRRVLAGDVEARAELTAPDRREVVRLLHEQGLPVEGIADRAGVSVRMVRYIVEDLLAVAS